jgi:RimJ/RimL family protein N-acetyltransferase
MTRLNTARLLLRQWQDSDRDPWAKMCADPEVMRFLSSSRDRATSDAAIDRWQARITEQGWSFWAVQLTATGQFLGMTGLQVPAEPHPYLPCIEVGWRLAREHWGKGYASEAASRALRYAFEELRASEIIATAAKGNWRSRAVMRRIGMAGPEGEFLHPGVPPDNPLREHVLYRVNWAAWAG